jgi:lysyl-tRNA synthetase class 2
MAPAFRLSGRKPATTSNRAAFSHELTSRRYFTPMEPDYPYADGRRFPDRDPVALAYAEAAVLEPDTESAVVRRLAGRVLARRGHGRLVFLELEDLSGRIQLLCSEARVTSGDTSVHLGDVVGVTGHPAASRSGQPSLIVTALELLSPNQRALPDHVHGLQDVEARYRRRHLDLLMNPATRAVFLARTRMVSALRRELDAWDFLEVETPTLQPRYGGANATPFTTHFNALNQDMFLRIAPELYLRRLIIGGLERVYELGRNFRNEGLSTRHNPEFTMLEWYEAYADYEDAMRRVEELVSRVALAVNGTTEASFRDHDLDLAAPFARLRLPDALAAEGLWTRDPDDLRAALVARGLTPDPSWSWAELIEHALERLVEPTLIQPTFLYDYPVELSPLARPNASDPTLTDRFELFIAGMEIANAYSEINDHRTQEESFTDHGLAPDEDFLEAQAYGMPPTAGVGLGVDRLAMVLTGSDSIREVILFPALRSE